LLFFDCLAIIIAGVIQINNIIVLFVCRLLQGFIIGNFMAITPIYIN
jgi:MFS family permease